MVLVLHNLGRKAREEIKGFWREIFILFKAIFFVHALYYILQNLGVR